LPVDNLNLSDEVLKNKIRELQSNVEDTDPIERYHAEMEILSDQINPLPIRKQ